jgi:hypothetical protein
MKSFRSSIFISMIALAQLAACAGDSGNGALSDAEVVGSDKAALVIDFAAGDSATSVTRNLTLSTHGSAGATIAWASDASGVISTGGAVTRAGFAAGDAAVTLTQRFWRTTCMAGVSCLTRTAL